MGAKQPKRSEAESLEDVIKARIKTLGLSAYAVGKQTGINAVVIQRFLNGERGINLATAEKLCSALDLVLVERPGSTLGSDLEQEQVN